jgi:hypothetical protein
MLRNRRPYVGIAIALIRNGNPRRSRLRRLLHSDHYALGSESILRGPTIMNTLKALIVVGIICAGLQYWNQHEAAVDLAAATDDNGFVDLSPMDGQDPGTVYVVAGLNCPHEDAQRADRLAKQLRDRRIPVVRTDTITVTSAVVDRYHAVSNGTSPLVLIRGRVKSNATLDQVVAELKMLQE